MSEEIEKFKKPQKRTVRYFGETNKVDSNDTEHINVNNQKKAIQFKGEVIQVQEKAKFYAKSKYANIRPEYPRHLIKKKKRSLVKLDVDPYAKERHSRKYTLSELFCKKEILSPRIDV